MRWPKLVHRRFGVDDAIGSAGVVRKGRMDQSEMGPETRQALERLRDALRQVLPQVEHEEQMRDQTQQLADAIRAMGRPAPNVALDDKNFYALVVQQMTLVTALADEVSALRRELSDLKASGVATKPAS
jgi:hypothetical protein